MDDPLPPIQVFATAFAPSTSDCLSHELTTFSITAAVSSHQRNYSSAKTMLLTLTHEAEMSCFTVTTSTVQNKKKVKQLVIFSLQMEYHLRLLHQRNMQI